MSDLDGGSAAPPTADVPTWQPPRRLRECVEAWPGAYDGGYDPRCCRFPKSCSATVYSDEHVTDDDLEPARVLDHSGVAGEPEATENESCSCWLCRDAEAAESAQNVGPTPTHAPTPETAGASNTTVPDEAVEALVRYLSEATLPAAWRTDDRWGRCRAGAIEAWGPKAREYLTLTAPLIAAQALRSYADQEHAGPEAVAQWTDYGTGEEYDAVCSGCSSSWDGDEGGCTERVALLKRADELERGGDR